MNQTDELKERLRALKAQLAEAPHETLTELRALFCRARAEGLKEQHAIVHLMTIAYFVLQDYSKTRLLAEKWLKQHQMPPDIRSGIMTNYAAALQVMGYNADAFTVYKSALKLMESAENSTRQQVIYFNLMFLCNNMGAYAEAEKIYGHLAPLLGNTEEEYAQVAVVYAKTLAYRGHSDEALEMLNRAYAYYDGTKNYRYQGFILERRGEIAVLEGAFDDALKDLQRAKRLLAEYGNASDLCYCCFQLGSLYESSKDFQAAADVYEEGVYSALLAHMPLLIDDAYYRLGICYDALGERSIAKESFKRHLIQIDKMEALRRYQQGQLLDLLLEKHQVESDTDQVLNMQHQLVALNREVQRESSRLTDITQRFEGLKQFALELSSTLGEREMLLMSIARLASFTDFDKALVGTWDGQEGCYAFREAEEQTAEGEFYEFYSHDLTQIEVELAQQLGCHSVLSTQIARHTYGHGLLLVLVKAESDAYDAYDKALIDAFGALLDGALRLGQQVTDINEQQAIHASLLDATKEKYFLLKQVSYYDELTGLFNRSGMVHCFDQWQLSTGFPAEMTACVFDLDHFKRYNDKHGHLAGDSLLKAFSKLLVRHMDNDEYMLARFGGEEFLLIGPGRRVQEIYKKSQSLLGAVERLHLVEDLAESITVSIGIGFSMVEDSAGLYDLIAIADQQLYRAKQSGRNRVCWTLGD